MHKNAQEYWFLCATYARCVTNVYRAPLRSRRDDVDPAATLARALRLGLCGFGSDATERRVERFAAVEDGALVWTRDADGLFWLGRLGGPVRYDDTAEAVAVDLIHVRPCTWCARPVTESTAPPAVVATFRRGGRNFQRIHDADVGSQSDRLFVHQAVRRLTCGPE